MAKHPTPSFNAIKPMATAVSDNDGLGRFGDVSGAAGLSEIRNASIAVNEAMRSVSDPRVLADAIEKKTTHAAKIAQNARAQLERHITETEKTISEAITGRSEFDTEIRAEVRKSGKAFSVLSAACRDGDLVTVSACLRAPLALTGLTQDQSVLIYREASRQFASSHEERRIQMMKVAERLDSEKARLLAALKNSDASIAAGLVAGTTTVREVA